MSQNFLYPSRSTEPAPQDADTKIPYASVTERFVAFLIDYALVFIVLTFIFTTLLGWLGKRYDPSYAIGSFLLLNFIFILYETICSCGDRTTLGKALVGIAVMRKDMQGPLSWWRALLRAVGYYISAGLLGCGFLLAFVDGKNRALHDFLGGSAVVEVRPRSALEKTLVRGLGGVLLAAFFAVVYFQYFGGRNWQEKYRVNNAENMLRKVAILQEGHRRLYGYYTNDLLRLALLSGDPVQFQRDMQYYLSPKGFQIGVTDNSYKITAYATDKNNTQVVWPK